METPLLRGGLGGMGLAKKVLWDPVRATTRLL
jgi:hypothetical protein